jgi:hypothetical protein
MPKYIIYYGFTEEIDIIEAESLDEAQMEATRRSMSDGLLDDDLADTTWAEVYDPTMHDDPRLSTCTLYEPSFLEEEPERPREEWPSVMDAAETPFADNH